MFQVLRSTIDLFFDRTYKLVFRVSVLRHGNVLLFYMFYNHKRWLAPDMSHKRNVLLFYCSTRTLGAKEATHSAVGAGNQAHVLDDRRLRAVGDMNAHL